MTRVEDLTLALVDGVISGAEAHELEELLDRDAEARRVHLAALAVEFDLRGRRRDLDMAPRVMEAISRDKEARVVRGVMARLEGPDAVVPPWRRRRARGVRAWAAPVALAASLVLVAAAALWRGRGPVRGAVPGAVPEAFASLVEARGAVRAGRGVLRPAVPGGALGPGERIETGPGGSATVAYLGVSLALAPETALTLDRQGGAPTAAAHVERRELRLERGTLSAHVAPQPLRRVIAFLTPNARATVVGTRLRLTVTDEVTRLAVGEGQVLLERLRDGSVITVGAGQEASAGAEPTEPAPVAAAARPARPPAAAVPAALMAFDFEDGVLPATFIEGQLVRCPFEPGGRFCLLGTVLPYWGRENAVQLGLNARSGIFHYSDTAVIEFDYWLGADGKRVSVQIWNNDKRVNYSYISNRAARQTWTRIAVRLRDFEPNIKGSPPMDEGDSLRNVLILGGRVGGEPFYVDNLRIVDHDPGEAP